LNSLKNTDIWSGFPGKIRGKEVRVVYFGFAPLSLVVGDEVFE
jgi:hypothetical protein